MKAGNFIRSPVPRPKIPVSIYSNGVARNTNLHYIRLGFFWRTRSKDLHSGGSGRSSWCEAVVWSTSSFCTTVNKFPFVSILMQAYHPWSWAMARASSWYVSRAVAIALVKLTNLLCRLVFCSVVNLARTRWCFDVEVGAISNEVLCSSKWLRSWWAGGIKAKFSRSHSTDFRGLKKGPSDLNSPSHSPHVISSRHFLFK